MQPITRKKYWTDEELMSLPDDGHKYELIDGGLVMTPAGFEHEIIGARLVEILGQFVRRHRLGFVLGSSLGVRLETGDLLSPDVSFIDAKMMPELKRAPKGFPHFAPDLAVEILSPHDSKKTLQRKVGKYFHAGTRLVWIINPGDRTVEVHRSVASRHLLHSGDCLDGEDVIPGFTMPISDLFAELDV